MIIHENIGIDEKGVYAIQYWVSSEPTIIRSYSPIFGICRLYSPVPRSKLELACKIYNHPIEMVIVVINKLPITYGYSEKVTYDYT